jgi:hypothetical protein
VSLTRAPGGRIGYHVARVAPRRAVRPAAGGLLAELSPRLPFFLYAGFLLVAGAVGVVLLRTAPESPGAPAEGRPDLSEGPVGLRAALRNPACVAALVANLGVGWVLFGVRNSLDPGKGVLPPSGAGLPRPDRQRKGATRPE